MPGFVVLDAETDREVGRAELLPSGEWRSTTPSVGKMVSGLKNSGHTDAQVLVHYYDGWSNGRLKTTPLS